MVIMFELSTHIPNLKKLKECNLASYDALYLGDPTCPIFPGNFSSNNEALKKGVASIYPIIDGIKPLKDQAALFVKNFMNIEVSPKSCIPTVGSMQGTFSAFLAAGFIDKKKDTALFIDPGFPVQKQQMMVLGLKYKTFDVFSFRGEKLRVKLEEILSEGNINSIIYSKERHIPRYYNLMLNLSTTPIRIFRQVITN